MFMQMLRSSQVRFLNQLLPTNSHLLRAQDCDTTVVGSEHGTVTHVEGEEDIDSIVAETEAPLIQLPCLGFEDLKDWSNDIVLKTAFSPAYNALCITSHLLQLLRVALCLPCHHQLIQDKSSQRDIIRLCPGVVCQRQHCVANLLGSLLSR
ncbi:hypothetical protein DSO57_1022524 [Entomophthora muscae]|uniref:Uncharacterized protein n=1 Tax=Entomophthora muscae TaxID=34485 RepID=A0ACC2RU42_9FUNG|nr:hypothetical protein DSO57_1022524 [Entomophthora muscae]